MFPFPCPLAKLQAEAVVKARVDGRTLRVPWLVAVFAGDLPLNSINIFPDFLKPISWGRCKSKASPMTEEVIAKIRHLNQSDLTIADRRALYNALGRKMKSSSNLKPGLVEKYQACISSRKERFNMLKEFLIDENMSFS